MTLTNLLILSVVGVAGSILFSLFTTQKKYLLYSTAILLAIAILGYSLDASAVADAVSQDMSDRSTTIERQTLEEDLNLTPDGGHYSGVEYAERTQGAAEAVSDEVIESTIAQYASDNLVIAVANGSVRVSGRVEDKETARHAIEQIKKIPGVHEITFNLGLDRKAS